MDIAVGDDFWGTCDQKRSYNEVSNIQRRRT